MIPEAQTLRSADPVAAELRAALGVDSVEQAPEHLLAYQCDGLALFQGRARMVVLPRSTEEVRQAIAILAKHGIPIVPRGAGTGLSGGATPVEGCAVVHLARMRRVLEVDAEDRFARVELGLVNIDLSARVAKLGLHYAPDPSSQSACTLGGNVALNAGGPHCFKYGATTLHVLGLKVVLSSGEVAILGGPEPESPGYDLRTLFVGSEGTLGIATEAWLKLTPKPEVVETLLAPFPTMDAACRAVGAIVGIGVFPSALEILDDRTIAAIEDSVFAAGYPRDAAAVLLVELDGAPAEVEDDSARVRKICGDLGALGIQAARDEEERKRLWKGRKGAFGAMGRVAPDLYVMDCVVPRSRLPEALAAIREICDRLRVRNANVFHAGDGNLHPNISYDGRDADEVARVLRAGEEIARACVALGGTLSGEHGIGIEKNEYLPMVFGDAELRAFQALRRAFDPAGIMNPGKALPSHICGEIAVARTAVATSQRSAVAPKPQLFKASGATPRPTPRIEDPLVEPGEMAHSAADFVVRVSGSTTLEVLARSLRATSQWLPIDPSDAEARTVGEIVFKNAWGPLRTGHGAVRDFLLGCRVGSPSGEVWSFGGKVVKSATGYDLHRLQVGARSTFGPILEATLRLRPLPAVVSTIEATADRWDQAVARAKRVRGLADSPAALFILGNGSGAARIAARFEGVGAAVARAVERAREVIGGKILDGAAADSLLAVARGAPYGGASRTAAHPVFSVRLVARPSRIAAAVAAALAIFDTSGARAEMCVHPGVAWADLWCSDALELEVATLFDALERAVAQAAAGSVSLRSPFEVACRAPRDANDPALAVMKRLKRALDPNDRFGVEIPGLPTNPLAGQAPHYPDR